METITCPTCRRVGRVMTIRGTPMVVDLAPECRGCRETMRVAGFIPLPSDSLQFVVGDPVGVNRELGGRA